MSSLHFHVYGQKEILSMLQASAKNIRYISHRVYGMRLCRCYMSPRHAIAYFFLRVFRFCLYPCLRVSTTRTHYKTPRVHGTRFCSCYMFQRQIPAMTPCSFIVFRWLPGFRELVMAAGIISVSRDSLEYILTKEGPGQSVVSIIGGSSEVLHTSPSWYQLVLNRRKGFIKLALETGCVENELGITYTLF
jgi:hypothetical protein